MINKTRLVHLALDKITRITLSMSALLAGESWLGADQNMPLWRPAATAICHTGPYSAMSGTRRAFGV